jgi:hypothetical protein
VTVSSVGASTWYARALDALTTREAKPEPQPEERRDVGVSVEEVTSPRAQRNLERVAGSLGMEPDALLAQLASGGSARALLSRVGDAGYGSSLAKSTTGGLTIDQYA